MEINVLLVDDEEWNITSFREEVEWKRLGISQVFGACSAEEARKLIYQKPIQLILCDIEMPGESGLDFIQWVREQSDLNGANVECVILTCYPDYKFMRKSMQIGCGDYLIKPVDYEELEGVIQKVIRKIRLNQDKFSYDDKNVIPEIDNLVEQKIIPYIQQHFQENLTVGAIADNAGLNPQYMMRLFKKTNGTSIMEYVTELRMEKAKDYLANTEWNNDMIAEKTGYASATYFIKLFKRQYGMTPREFRKGKRM